MCVTKEAEKITAMKAGKQFEKEFAAEARKVPGILFHRLMDSIKTAQPCDYFLVAPGITCFLELKSTVAFELPLINIRAHQLAALSFIDGSSTSVRAGFVVQFRSLPDNEIWYIPAVALKAYADTHGVPSHLPRRYMEQIGIRIKTGKRTPKCRTNKAIDVAGFLENLRSKT